MTDNLTKDILAELDRIFEMMPTEQAFVKEEARNAGYEKIEAYNAIKALLEKSVSKAEEKAYEDGMKDQADVDFVGHKLEIESAVRAEQNRIKIIMDSEFQRIKFVSYSYMGVQIKDLMTLKQAFYDDGKNGKKARKALELVSKIEPRQLEKES